MKINLNNLVPDVIAIAVVGTFILGMVCSLHAASTDTIAVAQSKLVELHITLTEPTAAETKKNKRKVENFSGHAICSGAFVTDRGDILTAKHCTEGAGVIDVLTADGGEYRATIVAQSPIHDLALIHIDRFHTPYFKAAATVSQGQTIYTLGSPLGISSVLNTGIIAKLNGDVNYMDCSALPGNSGGPAFNEDGDLVGVVTAGFIVLYGTTHLNILQSLSAVCAFALSIR